MNKPPRQVTELEVWVVRVEPFGEPVYHRCFGDSYDDARDFLRFVTENAHACMYDMMIGGKKEP
jgi:hypothetical protein